MDTTTLQSLSALYRAAMEEGDGDTVADTASSLSEATNEARPIGDVQMAYLAALGGSVSTDDWDAAATFLDIADLLAATF